MKKLLFICWCVALSLVAQAQSDWLDSGFNQTGMVLGQHAGSSDKPVTSLMRPDGRSLMVGYTYFSERQAAASRTKVVIAQFGLDGKPDPGFGTNGVVVLNQLPFDADAGGALLLPDGRLMITGAYLTPPAPPFNYIVCLLEDGSPDPAFGNNGIGGHPDPTMVIRGNTLARLPDGKIIMGGSLYSPAGFTVAVLTRFLPDGQIDSTFGLHGSITNGFASKVLSLAVDSANRIYAGGAFQTGIARFLPDGSPDNSFGINGLVTFQQWGGIGHILTTPEGGIIAGGPEKGISHSAFIVRLLENGASDPNFADAQIHPYSTLGGLAFGPGGKMTAATQYGNDLRLFRYLPDGALDTLFVHNVQLPAGITLNLDLSLTSDQRMLLGGTYLDPFRFSDYCILRLQENGSIDTNFGVAGLAIQGSGKSYATANTLLVDDENRLITGGHEAWVDATSIINLPIVHSVGFVSRHLPDGSLDSTFSGAGFRAVPREPFTLNLAARQSDGKIMVAGSSTQSSAALGAMRLFPDGSTDTTFGPYLDGFTQIWLDQSIYEVLPAAMCVTAENKTVIAGKTNGENNSQQIAIAVFDEYGWPDPGFGSDGLVLNNQIPGSFQLGAALVQPDGRIVLGGTYSSPIPNIFLMRFLADGTTDNTFGTDGIVLKPFTGQAYRLYALALQPDGNILLSGSQGGASSYNIITGRLHPDGSKDESFGNGGVAVVNTAPFEFAQALAVLPDGKIIVAGYYAPNADAETNDPFILRLLPNGQPDSSFAGTGYLATELPGDNQFKALAVQFDSTYVAAGYSNNEYLLVRYLSRLSVGVADQAGWQNEVWMYPNPVHGSTTLTYSLEAPAQVNIELFDVQGRRCAGFIRQAPRGAGEHNETLLFPPTLMPGVYVLRIQTERGGKSVRVVVQ